MHLHRNNNTSERHFQGFKQMLALAVLPLHLWTGGPRRPGLKIVSTLARVLESYFFTRETFHNFGSPQGLFMFLFVHAVRRNSIENYLVNKPLRRLVYRLIMSAAERWMSEKWTFGREARLRGQMWNFEDNLSAKDIISRFASKPERGLFIL